MLKLSICDIIVSQKDSDLDVKLHFLGRDLPLYKKGIKETQNKPMEVVFLKFPLVKMKIILPKSNFFMSFFFLKCVPCTP